MIFRTQVTFTAAGDRFTPSKMSAPFSHTHDPGDIARRGRLRGKPQPGGHASFDAPEEEKEKIAWLHRIVVPLLPALRESGADEFWLRITYHCSSGALGFSKEEIRMIAEMECDVPIDCLIDEEPNQAAQTTPGLRPRA